MFILELGSLPIGQIRFDFKKNNTAMIDYSLDPIARNRGWERNLLVLELKKFTKQELKKFQPR